jgi:hypothetical protein
LGSVLAVAQHSTAIDRTPQTAPIRVSDKLVRRSVRNALGTVVTLSRVAAYGAASRDTSIKVS